MAALVELVPAVGWVGIPARLALVAAFPLALMAVGVVTPGMSDVGAIEEGTPAKNAAGPAAVADVEPRPTGGLTDTEFVGSTVTTAKIEVDAAAPEGARSEAGRALTPRRYVVAIEVTSAT